MDRKNKSIFKEILYRPYRNNRHRLFDQAKDNLNLIQRMGLLKQLPVHDGCVNTLVWNHTGEYILSGSDDQRLVITNGHNYKVLVNYPTAHGANIFSAKFLPHCDDKQIVSCSGDGCILHTHLERPKETFNNKFLCHTGTTYEVITIPNDPHSFLSCGEDGTVRFFDLRIRSNCSKMKCTDDILITNKSAVTALAISPITPHQLCIGSSDSTVKIYDRRCLSTSEGEADKARPFCMFTSPDLEDRPYRITSLSYSFDAQEMLVSYSCDHLYLVSLNEMACSESRSSKRLNPPKTKLSGKRERRSPPPVRRLRLRGDWSDTGPDARPERENNSNVSIISQARPQLQGTLMQRMTNVLSRMLNDPMTRAALSAGGEDSLDQVPDNSGNANNPSQSPPAGDTEESRRDAAPMEVSNDFEQNDQGNQSAVQESDRDTSQVDYCNIMHASNHQDGLMSINRVHDVDINPVDNIDINRIDNVNINRDDEADIHREVHINQNDEMNVIRPDEININQADQVNIIQTDQVNINQGEQLNINQGEQLNINQADQVNINQGEQLNINQAGQVNINHGDQININQIDATNTNETESITHVNNVNISQVGEVITNQIDQHNINQIDEENINPIDQVIINQVDTENINQIGQVNTNQVDQVNFNPIDGISTNLVNEVSINEANGPSNSPLIEANIGEDDQLTNNHIDHRFGSSFHENLLTTNDLSRDNNDLSSHNNDLSSHNNDLSSHNDLSSYNNETNNFTIGNNSNLNNITNNSRLNEHSYTDRIIGHTIGNSQSNENVSQIYSQNTDTSRQNIYQYFQESEFSNTNSTSNEESSSTLNNSNSESESMDVSDTTSDRSNSDRQSSTSVPSVSTTPINTSIVTKHLRDRLSMLRSLRQGFIDQHGLEPTLSLRYSDQSTSNSTISLRVGGNAVQPEENSFATPSTSGSSMTSEVKKQESDVEMDYEICDDVESASGTIFEAPQKTKYVGHRNARTMIKEATFWGNEYVMSGSDCGHIFVWDKTTARLEMLLQADNHVVNCLQPHPTLPILATSGIDHDIKLWSPVLEEPAFDRELADKLINRNAIMLEETKDTITVPASFMIRMLACLNQIRQGARTRMRQRDAES